MTTRAFRSSFFSLFFFMVVFMLTACSQTIITSFTSPATQSPIIPTDTSLLPTDLPMLPTFTPLPSISVTVSQTPTLVPTQQTPIRQMVNIYLIALEDNGISGKLVGCGDSVIPIQVEIPPTQGVLRAALEALLTTKDQYYGESGLYNALYQSDLQLAGVTIEGVKAIIHLTGTLMLGGVCDNPRVEAQIEETALQFSTVNDVSVFINDKLLEEVISLK
ncbi:MAG: GerMN domain-containing protein [Anaerolineales bacterium]|nr:GerMN domain-containing protein [Anaerolineales bacterium]